MLSDLCRYLNNYFDSERLYGEFSIENGNIAGMGEKLQSGQYFRIIESVFNDGIYQYPQTKLTDETFTGSVWVLKIPPEVISISAEIDAWEAQYMTPDGAAMSPYTSESFGGYSYSKGGGENAIGSAWTGVSGFAERLKGWRKPRCRY